MFIYCSFVFIHRTKLQIKYKISKTESAIHVEEQYLKNGYGRGLSDINHIHWIILCIVNQFIMYFVFLSTPPASANCSLHVTHSPNLTCSTLLFWRLSVCLWCFWPRFSIKTEKTIQNGIYEMHEVSYKSP